MDNCKGNDISEKKKTIPITFGDGKKEQPPCTPMTKCAKSPQSEKCVNQFVVRKQRFAFIIHERKNCLLYISSVRTLKQTM